MALRMPLELREEERIPLSDFHRAMGKPVEHKGRIVMALVVLATHAALIAAIVWAGTKVYDIVVPAAPIEVAVIAEPPKVEIPPPPPLPRMMTPEVPIAVAPEITISAPPPAAAITVQQVKNPAPAAPASQVAGTGKDVYLSKIIAHLDAAKRYPAQARKLHIQGVVQLHFVMDRTGHVLNFDIAKSSGRQILDEETKALIARAQPLPPIPADWPQQTLNLVVPVEFELH
jgi:protein TonB